MICFMKLDTIAGMKYNEINLVINSLILIEATIAI